MGQVGLSLGVFALVALAFAGCLGASDKAALEGDQRLGLFAAPPAGYPSLEGLPLPAVDGEAVRLKIESFAETFAPRVTGTSGDDAAEAWLVGELEALGYDVDVMRFQPQSLRGQGIPDPARAAAPSALKAIIAKKEGAQNPDHWLAWGGHYDTSVMLGPRDATIPGSPVQPPVGYGLTLQGAYDNGSGTVMALEIARLMANVTTNKTVAAILFNGEEEGLLASEAFGEWYLTQDDFVIDHFTGFDMVGINWPAPGRPLLATMGQQFNATYMPLMAYVVHDVVGVPRDDPSAVGIFGQNHRNSDELNLDRRGVPTMRFAGMILARDYWAYHKANDTMETIHRQAGGPEQFAAGLVTIAESAYWTLMAIDRMAVATPNAE